MLCFGLPGVTGLCPKAKGASLSLLLPINSRKQAAGTFNRLCYSDDAPQLERTYGDSPQLAELLNGIRRVSQLFEPGVRGPGVRRTDCLRFQRASIEVELAPTVEGWHPAGRDPPFFRGQRRLPACCPVAVAQGEPAGSGIASDSEIAYDTIS